MQQSLKDVDAHTVTASNPPAYDAPDPHTDTVLAPGRNCWKVEQADRAAVIVDTADYFEAFVEACLKAERQIVILGWDFDRRERLFRDDEEREYPDQLGAFLVWLVKRRPALQLYLLSWDFNMIYAAERELLPALRLRMQAPPRFHFRLDGVHPKGASHHQKVVVIDDQVAFVGGIDLSRWRWDTGEHMPDDPRRIDPNGKPYAPFHDMMMVVEGEVAASLGELARERWHRARGWRIKPVEAEGPAPWPDCVQPQVEQVPVAIARTEPEYNGREAVHEVRQLYLDGIASAERFIYIENQYFTARCLADALAARLEEPHGPEVVLVLPLKTGAWLEQMTMDVLRGRVLATLRNADKHDRLRVYHPYQPGLGEQCVSVHAKLMIVDDKLLRIGSSNTSSRSMGLDTECDLATESAGLGDRLHGFAQGLRRRLLAEHLGCSVTEVEHAEASTDGLIATIEALRGDGRSLRPLDAELTAELDEMVPDAGLVDPSEPFSADYFVAEYVPDSGRDHGRKRLVGFVAMILALLAMAAAWRWTPLQEWLSPDHISNALEGISSPSLRAAVAVGGFLLASLLMVPLTLLAVIAGIVFKSWLAFAYTLAGALGAALIGFGVGRVLSRDAVRKIAGERVNQLSKRLAERGTIAVAVLRLLPVAPFPIFNMLAGASHLGFRQFLFGSLLGMAPGIGAVTLFSGTLWEAVTSPSPTSVAVAVGVGLALAAVAWLAKRWLRSG